MTRKEQIEKIEELYVESCKRVKITRSCYKTDPENETWNRMVYGAICEEEAYLNVLEVLGMNPDEINRKHFDEIYR